MMKCKQNASRRIKQSRQRSQKKLFCSFFCLLILVAILAPFQLGNTYLRCTDFETVKVQHQESVWNIAARYTDDAKQVKRLTQAIIEINELSADAEVKAGQKLKIPVIAQKGRNLTRLAER